MRIPSPDLAGFRHSPRSHTKIAEDGAGNQGLALPTQGPLSRAEIVNDDSQEKVKLGTDYISSRRETFFVKEINLDDFDYLN